MAFLFRLAKQQVLRSKPAQFELEIRSLKTEIAISGPIQVEWIRGSRRTAAIVDTTHSKNGCYILHCKLRIRATIFVEESVKGDKLMSKSSKLVFKLLEPEGLKTLGQISLELSGCFKSQPQNLHLFLSHCKDKRSIAELVIVGQECGTHNESSQCGSLADPASKVENEALPIEAKITPQVGIARGNVLIDKASIASESHGGFDFTDADMQKLVKMTPTEEFLSIQLQNTKMRLNEALNEIDQLQKKGNALEEIERETARLKNENMQLHQQLQGNTDTIVSALSHKNRVDHLEIECETLEENLKLSSQNCNKERLKLQNVHKLIMRIDRHIDAVQEQEINVKELEESYKIGENEIAEELQKMVHRIFQLRCDLKERQSQVERIGYQQQQVVDKWKSLAGKMVIITDDGDVEEIDIRVEQKKSKSIHRKETRRRSSLTLPASSPNSDSSKIATDSTLDMFRLEIQQLKQELERERSQYRKANLPESNISDLESQLLEAKVRLANLAEDMTSLEQENKQIKEQMGYSDWHVRFNKTIKNL